MDEKRFKLMRLVDEGWPATRTEDGPAKKRELPFITTIRELSEAIKVFASSIKELASLSASIKELAQADTGAKDMVDALARAVEQLKTEQARPISVNIENAQPLSAPGDEEMEIDVSDVARNPRTGTLTHMKLKKTVL
jgi:hypothetical protein